MDDPVSFLGAGSNSNQLEHQMGGLCGECQLLRKVIEKSPPGCRPVLQGVDAALRGIPQVVFANNPISGLLMLIGLFLADVFVGLVAIYTSAIAVLVAAYSGQEKPLVQNGLTQFNAVLVGTVLISLWPALTGGSLTLRVWLMAVGGAAATVILDRVVAGFLAGVRASHFTQPGGVRTQIGVPGFTFPFNLVSPPEDRVSGRSATSNSCLTRGRNCLESTSSRVRPCYGSGVWGSLPPMFHPLLHWRRHLLPCHCPRTVPWLPPRLLCCSGGRCILLLGGVHGCLVLLSFAHRRSNRLLYTTFPQISPGASFCRSCHRCSSLGPLPRPGHLPPARLHLALRPHLLGLPALPHGERHSHPHIGDPHSRAADISGKKVVEAADQQQGRGRGNNDQG